MSVRSKLCIFVAGLLVLDQVVKIWIKTHMMIGDEFNVFGDWFKKKKKKTCKRNK